MRKNNNIDYNIGDVIMRKFVVENNGKTMLSNEEYPGTVIYVHPKKRFITLEFNINGSTLRESYNLPLRVQRIYYEE